MGQVVVGALEHSKQFRKAEILLLFQSLEPRRVYGRNAELWGIQQACQAHHAWSWTLAIPLPQSLLDLQPFPFLDNSLFPVAEAKLLGVVLECFLWFCLSPPTPYSSIPNTSFAFRIYPESEHFSIISTCCHLGLKHHHLLPWVIAWLPLLVTYCYDDLARQPQNVNCLQHLFCFLMPLWVGWSDSASG